MRKQRYLSMLKGLVLTGGKSSRMGADKAKLVYYGIPHADYLFQTLSLVCDQVYFSDAKDAQTRPNTIRDVFDITGPLNGILSAFHHAPESAWLIMAVDMPGVNEGVLNYLKANRDTSRIATCFYNVAERLPEPLLTIWEPPAYPLLRQFYVAGRVSPRDFLNDNDVNLLLPPDPRILLNINTPDEFRKFHDPAKD